MMKIKLFCLPYAGGSAKIFTSWRTYLDPRIAIVPVELAGRGSRLFEPMYVDRREAIEDSFNLIKDQIENDPYILFGHSMGALIAYELVQKIKSEGLPAPMHVFFSGSKAPHLKTNLKKYHLLDEEDFKNAVIELGGTPTEFFENPELMEIFLPLLKNDFKLAISMTIEEIVPLEKDISIFYGTEDELTMGLSKEWENYSKTHCFMYPIKGGHFFLNDEQETLVHIINKTCQPMFVSSQI